MIGACACDIEHQTEVYFELWVDYVPFGLLVLSRTKTKEIRERKGER